MKIVGCNVVDLSPLIPESVAVPNPLILSQPSSSRPSSLRQPRLLPPPKPIRQALNQPQLDPDPTPQPYQSELPAYHLIVHCRDTMAKSMKGGCTYFHLCSREKAVNNSECRSTPTAADPQKRDVYYHSRATCPCPFFITFLPALLLSLRNSGITMLSGLP